MEITKRVPTKPIWNTLPTFFSRGLKENQALCPACGGLGLYKEKDWFNLCQRCNGGIVTKCEYCGEYYNEKAHWNHNCKGKSKAASEKMWSELEKKEAEALEKATKLTWEEGCEKFDYFFSDKCSYNEGYFDDITYFFDSWEEREHDNEGEPLERPKYVFGTSISTINLDAYSIVENACENQELHEEAYDFSPKEMDDLQRFLDEWCETNGTHTQTYWEDRRFAVEIPWEEYDKNE